MQTTTQISHQEALEIVTRVGAELDKTQAGACVVVTDPHGELVALLKTDGCPLPSINNAINKAYTAARQMEPSADVGQASRDENFAMTNFGDLRYTSWGGGIPLISNGTVVGAVGVSGLPEETDIELARLGAALIR